MMKNTYWKLIIFLFIIHHLSIIIAPVSLWAQPQNWLWAHSGGGKGADQASSIAVDSSGNIFVTGYYADSALFSGITIRSVKGNHLFLAKYSKDGLLLWVKTSRMASGQSQGTAITIDKDNYLYLTGYFSDSLLLENTVLLSSGNDNIFLAKYDHDGNLQWARSGGGAGYHLSRAISTDKITDDIYITGSFSGTAHFGNKELKSMGGDDIFLIKYDSAGVVIWAKDFGSHIDDTGFGITSSDAGNIAITGTFGDTADFGGKSLIAKGKSDIFIAKYSPAGDLLWAEQAGDTAYGQGASIVMDAKENIYVTGRFYFDTPGSVPGCDGIGNIYIAKYSSSGQKLWMKCAGNGGEESGDGIAIDSSGSIYVTGGFDFRMNFGTGQIQNLGLIDAYIVKFNSAGIAQWADRAGSVGDDYGMSVALDRSGNIFLAGAFSDTSFFGSFQLQSQRLKDAFIAKLGNQSSVKGFFSSAPYISIYPNPSHSAITIKPANISKNSGITVEIITFLGVTCKKNIIPPDTDGNSLLSLSIRDLPKGIYFCRVSTSDWGESRMVVIQ